MPSPYSQTEISQTGDPTMGQVGAQNPNVNENLYAASYSNAPGRPADASSTGGGSDLATQGLMKLQQGDQYSGIMTLLEAAQQSPQSVQNPAFLQQLQIVESQSGATTGAQTDSSQGQFTPPSDSPAYGATGDTTAMNTEQGGAGQGDVNSIAMQALQAAQSNSTEGILGLMQASTMNPDLMNNQNFLTTMSEVLPQGPGAAAAQAQPGADASQQQQVQQPADASQYQQPGADASQQQQVQQPTDTSQYQQPVADGSQQPTASAAYTMPAQLTTSGNPQIEAGVKQAFQLIQSGDQFDGARLLMMIAKADPSILQDQAFVKNLTDLENAVKSVAATSTVDQTAAQSQSQQQLDAFGNPIAQPGAQQMVDASGNPVATDAQGMPLAQANPQAMTGMTGPTDTQAQAPVSMDPSSIGAPAS
ncbi:hypothetical protein BH10CYA1_BH10CYA1_38270 [soil metagenome]